MFDRHHGDVDGGGLDGAGPTVPVERTAPFDRASLRRMVTEIWHYLAELRYVDSVLPFVHDPERLRDTDPWPPYPGGPTFHDSIPKEVRLTLGTTFPFPVAITYSYPVTREYIDLYLAQLASSAQRWADDNIATLTARLTPIIRPEVSTYDQIRDHLDAVDTGLALHVSDDFGQLANNLNDWKGAAAENFADNFYSKFAKVREGQQWLLEALLAAAAAFQGTVRFSQHALMNTVTHVRDLLREQLRMRAEAQTGDTARVFLTVAAGVTSVLATIFSGGLAAGVTLAVGQGFAMAAQALPPQAPTTTISGSTAETLCDQFVDEIRRIEHFLGDEYDNLHRELRQVVKAWLDTAPLAPSCPYLVEGVPGRQFHHVTSDYYR